MNPKNPSLRVLDERRKFEALVSIGIRRTAYLIAVWGGHLSEKATAMDRITEELAFMKAYSGLHEYDLAVIGQEYMRAIEGSK